MIYTQILLTFLILAVTFLFSYIIYNDYMEKKNKNKEPTQVQKQNITPSISFEECNNIIDYIIDDIYKNKYQLNYKLREVTIIHNIEADIMEITKDVINAFSSTLIEQITYYYQYEYFIKMVTRKVQMHLIDYTYTNKPSIK